MAGQPQKQLKFAAIKAELEKRVEANECADILDYVELYLGSGQSLTDLTKEISGAIHKSISREHVRRVIKQSMPEDGQQRIDAARNTGLRAMLEETLDIADKGDEKLQVDTRFRLAAMLDPSLSPNKGSSVSVNFSLGQLHLEALRHRAVDSDVRLARARVSSEHADSSPAEVISIATVSDSEGSSEGAGNELSPTSA